MFQRKQRRFRRRTNHRGHMSHGNGDSKNRVGPSSFSNGQGRNNFRPFLSPEKLFEKYSSLAKEAMSTGDKTLAENYLQHADHFMRIVEDKNRNRNQSKIDVTNKSVEVEKQLSNNTDIKQDKEIKSKD